MSNCTHADLADDARPHPVDTVCQVGEDDLGDLLRAQLLDRLGLGAVEVVAGARDDRHPGRLADPPEPRQVAPGLQAAGLHDGAAAEGGVPGHLLHSDVEVVESTVVGVRERIVAQVPEDVLGHRPVVQLRGVPAARLGAVGPRRHVVEDVLVRQGDAHP
jgi:hypothetical protein